MTTSNILSQLGSPGVSTGFKNRIINGAMVIDQRNAGANSVATGYTLDRWQFNATQSNKGTWGQNFGSSSTPAGFTNYLGFQTGGSAVTLGAGDYFRFMQVIEGYNCADLGWGTANAKTVTLSFWVYSSLTGTLGGCVQNAATNRSYPFTYSIPVANTWTQISVTIAGDTTGTWPTTNGGCIQIQFGLGVGSTYSGTAGSWSANNYISATGAVNVLGTVSATWYLTGVQLEVGTTATNFDFRSYGTELALCQRYYYKWSPTNTGSLVLTQAYTSGAVFGYGFAFPSPMRTTPTMGFSGYSDFKPYTNVGALSTVFSTGGFVASSPYSGGFDASGSTGLTAGNASNLWHSLTAYVTASAEL